MAVDQDISPRHTTLIRTTEAEKSTHIDRPDFTKHVDTLGFTTGPTTTRYGKTEKPSTAGDVTIRQTTEMERSSTVGLMMDHTSDQYKVIIITIIIITVVLHIKSTCS